MAEEIFLSEARFDSRGQLMRYDLPPEDGGGRFEIAGINERYDAYAARFLAALIESGKQEEARDFAVAYIAKKTDAAHEWTSYQGVEFVLRDTIFNRGERGAAITLQFALNTLGAKLVVDGRVGPKTRAAAGSYGPEQLITALRIAREWYERKRRDESSQFWKGLKNRWDRVTHQARTVVWSKDKGH